MPAVGKRSDVTKRAMTRLGAITSEGLTPTGEAQDDCLYAAIDWYGQLRPLRRIFESAGDGVTRRFVLATLIGADWIKGTSEAASVAKVTNANTNDESAQDLDISDWQQLVAANGDDVLMIDDAVAVGTTLRIGWTSPHAVDAGDATLTTIPTKDAEAFVSMFAGYLARWISRRASDLAMSSLGADQVDAEPIGERWKRRAVELEKMALERLAPTSESVGPAGASIQWTDESTNRPPRIGH